MLAAVVVNANPFRGTDKIAQPYEFDPYGLLERRNPVEPKVRIRVSALKSVFTDH